MSSEKYIYAIGRRKSSSAVVKLFPRWNWTFSLKVNDKESDIKTYFKGIKYLEENVFYPFSVLGKDKNYDAQITVSWGWIAGQAEAIRLAFARALVEYNSEFRTQLKPFGLLKRDPRAKERKKFWLKWARKSPQWSKR